MLDRLEECAAREQLKLPVAVFFGGHIGRGDNAYGVLELFASGRPFGFERRLVGGAGERAALQFISNPVRHPEWLTQGGLRVIASYGVDAPERINSLAEARVVHERFMGALPPAHVALLRGMERFAVYGDYVFSAQRAEAASLLLEDEHDDEIKRLRAGARKVVHGGGPLGSPLDEAGRINVDTGAYASGVLSAARLDGARVRVLSVDAIGPLGPTEPPPTYTVHGFPSGT
jgi:serine/threonine protein phosphatase 1